jgi:glycosyltransferase involved in cell wall biosynthesis
VIARLANTPGRMPVQESPIRLFHAFSTFALGGAQARFVRLARALGPRFHHMVTAMDRCYDAARQIEDLGNIELYDVPSTRGRNLNNVPGFLSALRKVSPDRLITYNFGSIEWAFANARARLPHLHVEDGFGPDETERRLLRRSLLRAGAFRLSRSTLITISETIAGIAQREWFLPRRRITLIPNGIDAHRYRLASQRPGHSVFAPAGETVIGTVAGLRAEKRIDRLLHAVALLPSHLQVVLVIAGSGPLRDSLEKLACELGLDSRTRFLGQRDDIEDLYAAFDIFALSSDTEQLPLVLLEAMAAGLPVAGTDVGDLRSALGEGNHRWLCPRDAERLSHVLGEMIESPELRSRVGIENASIVRERFTAATMYRAWERAFCGPPSEHHRDQV